MATMQTTEPGLIGDAKQAERATTRIAEIRARLATIGEERAAVGEDLGQARAAVELGNRRAAPDVGRLALKRTGLETEEQELRQTAAALESALAQWQGIERDRERIRVTAELDQLAAEGRALEERFAVAAIEAMEAARAPAACERAFESAMMTAARLGAPTSLRRPRTPFRVPHVASVEDPAAYVARWQATGEV